MFNFYVQVKNTLLQKINSNIVVVGVAVVNKYFS